MNLTTLSLEQRVAYLSPLASQLQEAITRSDQLVILDQLPIVQEFLQISSPLHIFFEGTHPDYDYAIKSIIAIGEAPIVFNQVFTKEYHFEQLHDLLDQLLELDYFYRNNGGIVGYHVNILKLIANQYPSIFPESSHYLHPEGTILEESPLLDQQMVRWGLESLPHLAEMYPVGGAGERLNLIDEETGESLPVAKLPFLGRTLLEGIIRDLQAREYLYYKLFDKQLTTPLALMTSVEKNNHRHILNICKTHHWFGRESKNFYFFIQPQVPALTSEGHWSLSAPLKLTLKPSGHGAIWKLAAEQGIFSWFESQQRFYCLVRQINNPLAGTDQALLAFTGWGCHQQKAFGFLSCERLLNHSEGTNIVIETKSDDQSCYCLTNIEYTEFQQRGIQEVAKEKGSPFSCYPANTNILFAHLSSIQQALEKCSIPGQLINMKSQVPFIDPTGHLTQVLGGRLESTMQNIADHLVDCFAHPLNKEQLKNDLKTFILFNRREKTISTTKNLYKPNYPSLSTPEQAYYDLLKNHYDLFKTSCQWTVPTWSSFEDYLIEGPSVIILFHPGLGPLYQVIKQKIRGGSFKKGSELQLEIAEVDIQNLTIDGSLLIESSSPLGHYQTPNLLTYGQESRCTLHHVIIKNQGINRDKSNSYWKNQLIRNEEVKIILGEGAEFYAESITLEGSHQFEVPPYHSLTLKRTTDGQWQAIQKKITHPSWQWKYTFSSNHAIELSYDNF